MVLALTLPSRDIGPALQGLKSHQQRTIERFNEIIASAATDAQGKVSPGEYGRLLLLLAEATGAYKSLKNLPELVAEYADTLEGPQNPEELTTDLREGKCGEILNEAVAEYVRRASRGEL